jgi:hypothetical protein
MFQLTEEDKRQFVSGLMIAIALGIGIGTLARIVMPMTSPISQANTSRFIECMDYCKHSSYIGYCIQECERDKNLSERFIKQENIPSIIKNDSIINYSFQ